MCQRVEIHFLCRRSCDGAYSCAYLPTCNPRTANLAGGVALRYGRTKLSFHRDSSVRASREIRRPVSLRVYPSRSRRAQPVAAATVKTEKRTSVTMRESDGRIRRKGRQTDGRTDGRMIGRYDRGRNSAV